MTLFVKRNQQQTPKKGGMRAGSGTVNRSLPDIPWGGGAGLAQADVWPVGSVILGRIWRQSGITRVYYEREVVARN